MDRELRAGNREVMGLCLALADWSSELRLIQKESDQEAKKPAAAGAGRARKEGFDATG